jgi:hypothetical protein
MKRVLILFLALSLASCTGLQRLETAYTVATTTTVPANVVIPAANAFDALKATATNYGRYCISQKFAPAICSAANRRAVIKFVRAGTAARIQLESSLSTGQPALGTVYNALIAAVNGLQGTPINNLGTTP